MTSRRQFLTTTVAAIGAPAFLRGRYQLFPWSTTEYTARCIGLMKQATVIDMLFPLTLDFGKQRRWNTNPETFTAADFERYKTSGIHVAHHAVGFGGPNAYEAALKYFLGLNGLIAGRDDYLMRIDSAADLDRVRTSGKLGILLGVQNADHFQNPNHVAEFYGYGQRVSQLTYNSRNWIGNGSTERQDEGLSDFGLRIVARMNEVGMAIDVSHCGDKTSLDA